MRIVNLFLYYFMLAILTCSNINKPEQSHIVILEKLMVEGETLLMLGAQLRTDSFLPLNKKASDKPEALSFISTVTTIAVIRLGAQLSIPTLNGSKRFMLEKNNPYCLTFKFNEP